MAQRDPELSPIELLEEGPDWQIWEHYDTSGKVTFSKVIVTSFNSAPRLNVIALDEDIASDPGGYIRSLIEGLDLIGTDWFLELFSSRPLGMWCAEGRNQENIIRLK